jgi:N-ethylmaleimide reductase
MSGEPVELFRPIQLGPLTLKNRIVMSPMTRARSPGGVPNDLNVEYYSSRADAGLLFAESTAISPEGAGLVYCPYIFNDDHAAGWKRVTDAVHAKGGRIVLQLFHCGHNLHPSMHPRGEAPFGPSAIPAKGTIRTPEGRLPLGTPRELKIEEIPGLIGEYRRAATYAKQAGFDFVEVHSGNGYLLDQFLRDSTNKRTDAYGGSPENRRRLLLEAVDAVIGVWGRDRVGVRISPTNPTIYEIVDSDPETLFSCVVDGLEKAGIAFLDVVEGNTGELVDQYRIDFDKLRSRFSGVYIANNRHTYDTGNAAIRSGHADMISFGRPFIANPDLVRRFRLGVPLNPLNRATLYDLGASGYLDYPVFEGETATG